MLRRLMAPIRVFLGRPGSLGESNTNLLNHLGKAHNFARLSFSDFQLQIVQSRPDLSDVRNYNREMIDVFCGLYPLRAKTLVDVGTSPHGFAMERALEVGIAGYCGIGLGVLENLLVAKNSQFGVLVRMNADHLEFPPNTFDALLSLSTFEHFFHPEIVLTQMYSVLKPGGKALISFQPVWTARFGHHLHHVPDVCELLPPWAQLKWTKAQMIENLSGSWPPTVSMQLAEVVHWIYESDEVNRISGALLRHAIETSPFKVEWLTPLVDALTPSEQADAETIAGQLGCQPEELAIKGYSALLSKVS